MVTRRSARLKEAANPMIEDVLIDSDKEAFTESLEEELEELEFEPKKKRRKVTKTTKATAEDEKVKKVRGRRGLLSSLKEFPLDVLFEIFGHLYPMDLLNLSRTTKEIRGILMVRSSAFIWKESRSNVEGLPDLPPDLCEPQYANLVFGSHCHECFTTPVQTVVWSARTRMCKKCLHEHFGDPLSVATATGLDRSLLCLVPSFEEGRRGRRRWRMTTFYSIAVASKLRGESEPFIVNGVLEVGDEFLEWRRLKKEEADQLNAHADLCAAWAANRSSDRSNELDEARRLRREAIVERLTALGWGEEIPFHRYDFDSHKLVKQPKELTDRIWKNIEAPLVEWLTDAQNSRLKFQRQKIIKERRLLAVEAYNKFRQTFSPNTVFPPKLDVIRTEIFRAVIEDTPIHTEEKVTEESFATAVLTISQFSDDWMRCKNEELLEIMKKTSPNSVEADLQLATTFFACSRNDYIEPIGDDLESCLGANAWNTNHVIRFHAQASRIARSVLLACGLDPDVTTAAEMEEINPLMECLKCKNEQGRLVMRFVQTMSHSCKEQASWKFLTRDDELLADVQEKLNFSRISGYSTWQEDYCCKFCDHPRTTLFKLQEHMVTAHSETLSLDNVKFYIDTSVFHLHPRPIRLVPPPVEEVVTKEGGEAEEVKEPEEVASEVVSS